MISPETTPESQSSDSNPHPKPSAENRTLPKVKLDFNIFKPYTLNEDLIEQMRLNGRRKRKEPRHFRKEVINFSNVEIPLSSINQVDQLEIEIKAQILNDDDDGHLNFDVGDTLEKYELLGILGKGTFGRVANAENLDTHQNVALKITRNTEGCQESARNEIVILNKLREIDPEGKHLWIQMLDHFEVQGHVCIAFEKLGDSLYTFLRENKYRPYQLSQIKHIAYQLCYSVKALHDNLIIHTDLKPENICFVSSSFGFGVRSTRQQVYRKPLSTNIKLIDFGSAIDFFDDRDITIQTRYYRAPEVVFELHWNQAVDVWSIGCILFELYTGYCLFTAHDDDEHYRVMEDVLGPFPDIYQSTELAKKHDLDGCPIRKKKSHKPLKKYMHMAAKEHHELFDLLEKMLKYNPKERLTLKAALEHPFFLMLSDDQKL